MTSESEEWLEELVTGWVEVHKKSMTTLVLLRIVSDRAPAPAADIGAEFAHRTGWAISERGLYRTLKRLAGSDLMTVDSVPVERTGRPRKDFTLTDLGRRYLARLEEIADSIDHSPRPSKG
ncbi:PadR family transcriptional regulator [Janibacter corallicola]|uniref:PadR family transcriptional regulator n=1 Tax=Janibacter corallicola TaxID=415212 RepID=UPI000831F78B|nr:PadR family transcriptional regulator [Janibacter corallicola]